MSVRMKLTMCWQFLAALGPTYMYTLAVRRERNTWRSRVTYAGTEAELGVGNERGPFMVLESLTERVAEHEGTNYRDVKQPTAERRKINTYWGCRYHLRHGGRVHLPHRLAGG